MAILTDLFEILKRDIPFEWEYLKDTGDNYELELFLPGVEKDELSLKHSKWYIEINVKDSKYINNLTHKFSIPTNVDPSSVKAKLSKGVLSIKIDKVPKDTPKDIQID